MRQIVCDRKSMLYLYGLMLDYKDAMIGGGSNSPTPMPHKPAAAVHLVFNYPVAPRRGKERGASKESTPLPTPHL